MTHPAEAQSGDDITCVFGGLEGFVCAFVEGNGGDLSVVQILQFPYATLAPITLGSHNAAFYHLSRLKEKHACLTAPPSEPRPPWW